MILTLLKTHTQAAHERVEALVRVMDDQLTLDGYVAELSLLSAFYAPLEAALQRHELPESFQLSARLKSDTLRRDLHTLGRAADRHAPPEFMPHLPTPAHAAGAMYVLEGATLGGQIISRHVRRQLGLSPERGLAFFSSYGPDVGRMWRSFGEAITQYAARTGQTAPILEGAASTFESLEGWLLSPHTARKAAHE